MPYEKDLLDIDSVELFLIIVHLRVDLDIIHHDYLQVHPWSETRLDQKLSLSFFSNLTLSLCKNPLLDRI